MRTALTVLIAGVLATLLVCSLNYAQDGDEEDTGGGNAKAAGQYEYIIASMLFEKQEEYLGKPVKLVDDLAVLWDDPTPHDSKEKTKEAEDKGYKGDYDNQTMTSKGYIKFDTLYFRCMLPDNLQSSVDYLRRVNRLKTFYDPKVLKPEAKLVAVYGKLVRVKIYDAEDTDAETPREYVILMTDKVERPAERFFKDEPNEEEQ